MTQRVDPSKSGTGHYASITAALRAGRAEYVVPSSKTEALDIHPAFTATSLNAFASSHSSSSLSVTVDTGEALVGGSWLAKDTTTSVSLSASTAGQTVYVGVDASATNTVIIGLSGAFGSNDPKIPLHTYDTDGSGVTAHTDERKLGYSTETGQLFASEAHLGATEFNEQGETEQALGAGDGEVARHGSPNSDIVTVAGQDGLFHIAYNAYYDGANSTWRHITADDAYTLTFDTTGMHMRVSTTATPSADQAVAGWHTFDMTNAGDLAGNGTTFYDTSASAVPQARQGGPAGSLSGYPIPAGDISDGSGSGLDSDTVDGYHAGDLQGGAWNTITSGSDTDATTALSFDTGAFATNYDLYKIQVVYVNHNSGENFLAPRVNNVGTSNYNTLVLDYMDKTVQLTGWTRWKKVATTEANEVGQVTGIIRGASAVGTATGTNEYPTATFDGMGNTSLNQAVGGTLKEEHSTVDSIQINSDKVATGKYKVLGLNI